MHVHFRPELLPAMIPETAKEETMRRFLRRWGAGEREEACVGESQFLARDEVLRIPGGREASLRVDRGVVLVTREGDPEDHVLLSGMEVAVPGRGKTLAWALEPALVHVRLHVCPDRAARAGDRSGAPSGLRDAAFLAE